MRKATETTNARREKTKTKWRRLDEAAGRAAAARGRRRAADDRYGRTDDSKLPGKKFYWPSLTSLWARANESYTYGFPLGRVLSCWRRAIGRRRGHSLTPLVARDVITRREPMAGEDSGGVLPRQHRKPGEASGGWDGAGAGCGPGLTARPPARPSAGCDLRGCRADVRGIASAVSDRHRSASRCVRRCRRRRRCCCCRNVTRRLCDAATTTSAAPPPPPPSSSSSSLSARCCPVRWPCRPTPVRATLSVS